MGDFFMQKTETTHKIDKVTYIVVSCSSENATDTLKEKINKLILRKAQNFSTNINKNHQ